MRRYRFCFLLPLVTGAALALAGGDVSTAQTEAPVNTLTQALAAAYYNNPMLQQQRAVLRQADENVPAAVSGWRPTIVLSGGAGRVVGSQTELISAPKFTETIDERRNEALGQATLNQPIYSGGKTTAATRQAKNNVFAQRARLLSAEETVFLAVVKDYVAVVTASRLLALEENNITVSQRQLEATNAQFRIGELTITSLAQAQAALARARQQMATAFGNLAMAKEDFQRDVGVYPGDLAPPQPLRLPFGSGAAASGLAQQNNPNVIAAEFANAAAKDGVDVAFSALLPQFSLQASGFYQTNPIGADSRLSGGSVLGQVSVPLYQGGQEYAAIRQARAKAQQSFSEILMAERSAEDQAAQAWDSFIASRQAVVAANAEIKANAIALDGVEREEIGGTRTIQDVLYAQQLLLQSEVQQVQDIGTLVTATYSVAAATGRLTAADLGVPVVQYDDLKYYDAVRQAGFGIGSEADSKAGIGPDGSFLNTGMPTGVAVVDPMPGDATLKGGR